MKRPTINFMTPATWDASLVILTPPFLSQTQNRALALAALALIDVSFAVNLGEFFFGSCHILHMNAKLRNKAPTLPTLGKSKFHTHLSMFQDLDLGSKGSLQPFVIFTFPTFRPPLQHRPVVREQLDLRCTLKEAKGLATRLPNARGAWRNTKSLRAWCMQQSQPSNSHWQQHAQAQTALLFGPIAWECVMCSHANSVTRSRNGSRRTSQTLKDTVQASLLDDRLEE